MVDYERKDSHFSFKRICWLKVNNWGKCLILFLQVLSIREAWLSLYTLLNSALSRQFYSEMLFKKDEKTFQFFFFFLDKLAEKSLLWSISVFVYQVFYFDSSLLILNFQIFHFGFLAKVKFFLHFKNLLEISEILK